MQILLIAFMKPAPFLCKQELNQDIEFDIEFREPKRDVRSRMKNELEYQVNEKQENCIRLKE